MLCCSVCPNPRSAPSAQLPQALRATLCSTQRRGRRANSPYGLKQCATLSVRYAAPRPQRLRASRLRQTSARGAAGVRAWGLPSMIVDLTSWWNDGDGRPECHVRGLRKLSARGAARVRAIDCWREPLTSLEGYATWTATLLKSACLPLCANENSVLLVAAILRR